MFRKNKKEQIQSIMIQPKSKEESELPKQIPISEGEIEEQEGEETFEEESGEDENIDEEDNESNDKKDLELEKNEEKKNLVEEKFSEEEIERRVILAIQIHEENIKNHNQRLTNIEAALFRLKGAI